MNMIKSKYTGYLLVLLVIFIGCNKNVKYEYKISLEINEHDIPFIKKRLDLITNIHSIKPTDKNKIDIYLSDLKIPQELLPELLERNSNFTLNIGEIENSNDGNISINNEKCKIIKESVINGTHIFNIEIENDDFIVTLNKTGRDLLKDISIKYPRKYLIVNFDDCFCYGCIMLGILKEGKLRMNKHRLWSNFNEKKRYPEETFDYLLLNLKFPHKEEIKILSIENL